MQTQQTEQDPQTPHAPLPPISTLEGDALVERWRLFRSTLDQHCGALDDLEDMFEAPDASSEALVRAELQRIACDLEQFAAFAAAATEAGDDVGNTRALVLGAFTNDPDVDIDEGVRSGLVLGFGDVLDHVIGLTSESTNPRDRRIADAATVLRGLFPSVAKPGDDASEVQ